MMEDKESSIRFGISLRSLWPWALIEIFIEDAFKKLSETSWDAWKEIVEALIHHCLIYLVLENKVLSFLKLLFRYKQAKIQGKGR